MTFKRHGWMLVTAIAGLLVLTASVLPWHSMVEGRLKTMLEGQGFQNVQLKLSHVGLQSIVLEEIQFGTAQPLHLKKVLLNYSPLTLLMGEVHELVLSGLSVDLRQDNTKWSIGGLDDRVATTETGVPFLFPVTHDQIAAIPFGRSRLEESTVRLITPQGQTHIPLQMEWQKEPAPKLVAKTASFAFKAGSIEGAVGEITAEGTLGTEKTQWDGAWTVTEVTIKGAGQGIPVMNGGGLLMAQADHMVVEGQVASADKAYAVNFSHHLYTTSPEKSELVIVEAAMPWMGGTLSAQNVRIPLGKRQPLTINLNLHHVSIESLLKELTGKQASATGFISGVLPVTINEDGSLVFHEGALRADEAGTIALPPDSIPGDNEQVAFVREVLKNLHYTILSLSMNSDHKKKLSIVMAVEGQNPDVLSGRAVKINVHLTGDMLGFVQQNILLLSDPKQLLERGENENE